MTAKILIPIATAAALSSGALEQTAYGTDDSRNEPMNAKDRKPQSLLMPALKAAGGDR